MQVSVEKNDLECSLTVGLPRTQIDAEVQKRLQNLARTTRVNGFRPGKVPVRVIKQRFGIHVKQEVLGELMQESLQEALEQEKLRPAGMPQVEFAEDDGNSEELAYTATFELYPEIENVNLEGVNVERISASVEDGDVQTMVEKLRTQRTEWETVEETAADKDRVVIDYSGVLEGESEPFEGGEGKDDVLELGSGRMIEGFEAGLVGSKAGDEVSLNLSFPDDYHSNDVAGRAVTFSVTVHEVRRAQLPEIDAEFIQAFGVESGEESDFLEEIRSNMTRELEQNLQKQLKTQVTDALLAANDIQVPSALIESDAAQLRENMEQEFSMQGIDAKQLQLNNEQFMPQAEKRVKLGLVMGAVIQQQSLEADADKVRAAVERMAESYEDPESVIDWFYSKPENLRDIEATVLEDEVVDWVLSQVEVVEVIKPFSEVMDNAALNSM